MKKVLILCTGNSCRSQMGEALINSRLGDHFEAYSAGTQPSGYVHPKAVVVMADLGIDLSHHESKSTELYRNQYFDHVITVCDSAYESCPIWLDNAGQKTHISFIDPADVIGTDDEVTAVFRQVRDDIADRLLSLLQQAKVQ